MADLETNSYWSHLLGRAMYGELEGTELRAIPAVMTTWQSWRTQHPKTTVLDYMRTSEAYRPAFYESPQEFVLGYEIDGQSFHVGLDTLRSRPLLNLSKPRPHVIVFDSASTVAVVFDRTVEGETLVLRRSETGTVRGGGTTWNSLTGHAISGDRRGRRLQPIVGIMSYRTAWRDFHPDSVRPSLPLP